MKRVSGVVIALALAGQPMLAHAQAAKPSVNATSADARLKALYNAEWNWRAKEFGRDADDEGGGLGDSLQHVDATSQQRR
jgi:hypothetical protein